MSQAFTTSSHLQLIRDALPYRDRDSIEEADLFDDEVFQLWLEQHGYRASLRLIPDGGWSAVISSLNPEKDGTHKGAADSAYPLAALVAAFVSYQEKRSGVTA